MIRDKLVKNNRFYPRLLETLTEEEKQFLQEQTQSFPPCSLEHRARLFCLGFTEWPICQLEGCSSPVQIGKTNGFYICKGCCDEHIKKINAQGSSDAQRGKTNTSALLSPEKREEHLRTIKERGFNVLKIPDSNKPFKELLLLCPSCFQSFKRSVHNCLITSPLCKSCADKQRGNRESTSLSEYQERCLDMGITLTTPTFETKKQHEMFEFTCSCGKTFQRLAYSVLAGHSSCPACSFQKSVSEIEKELRAFIESLGVSVIPSFREWNKSNLEIDVFCPELKIGFEMNGMYYHSDEKKYPFYHKMKTDKARESGIRLVSIFEDEWEGKNELVKNKIKSILGFNELKPLGARSCQIVDVDSSLQREFENKYHIQGFKRSTFSKGLVYQDELISLLSIFGNKIERFCSKRVVLGGFQKLLAACELSSVETFCDLRWSDLTNNIYSRSGFTLDHITNPGYFYFKNKKRYSRNQFQKHLLKDKLELFDETLSESQNMKNNGFLRLWDCGHALFKYQPRNRVK